MAPAASRDQPSKRAAQEDLGILLHRRPVRHQHLLGRPCENAFQRVARGAAVGEGDTKPAPHRRLRAYHQVQFRHQCTQPAAISNAAVLLQSDENRYAIRQSSCIEQKKRRISRRKRDQVSCGRYDIDLEFESKFEIQQIQRPPIPPKPRTASGLFLLIFLPEPFLERAVIFSFQREFEPHLLAILI